MDIKILEYFLIVAREENITRASQILHITQPTLSRQLKQLEDELDVKLFRRSDHCIYLTEEGMLFRRRAEEIVNLVEKAKAEFVQDDNEILGTIAIGCGEMASIKELSKLISDFQVRYPGIKIELYSSNNEDIKERMEQGHLDVGLLLEPVNCMNYKFVRMKTKEVWGAIVHKDTKFAKQTEIRPGELVGTPVITYPPNTAVHNELVAWSGDYATNMDFSATYNALYNAVILAREKKSVVISLQLESHFEDMRFIPFSPKIEFSSILVWKEQVMQSTVINLFIEYIKELYKK